MNHPKSIDISPLRDEAEKQSHKDYSGAAKAVVKAKNHNASYNQARDLGVLHLIDVRDGSWLVAGKYWWYPQARKWRIEGKRKYNSSSNFTEFLMMVRYLEREKGIDPDD